MSAADAIVFPVEMTVRAWEVDRLFGSERGGVV